MEGVRTGRAAAAAANNNPGQTKQISMTPKMTLIKSDTPTKGLGWRQPTEDAGQGAM